MPITVPNLDDRRWANQIMGYAGVAIDSVIAFTSINWDCNASSNHAPNWRMGSASAASSLTSIASWLRVCSCGSGCPTSS